VARRAPLKADPRTDAFRWVNAEADGLPGVTVDGFGDLLVVSLYRELAADEEASLLELLEGALAPRAIYLKRRPKEARVLANTAKGALAPELPSRGDKLPETLAKENGLTYRIRPGQGLSVGLYLDMRDIRAFVREALAGATVLNTFAYTCAFSVASLAGGAARVVNVDVSRKVLDWGRENHALNHLPPEKAEFWARDVFEHLRHAAKRGESFDAVLLDPPSFATTRKSRFSAARDYAGLVALAAPLVKPAGHLLACCNLAQLSERAFENLVAEGLARARRSATARRSLGPSPIDFPAPPGQEPALKARWLALR
jgi:23S rRNA (cytosine1962-C5)-methyltransferase